MKTLSDIKNDGGNACAKDLPKDANPYNKDRDDCKYEAWEFGWKEESKRFGEQADEYMENYPVIDSCL